MFFHYPLLYRKKSLGKFSIVGWKKYWLSIKACLLGRSYEVTPYIAWPGYVKKIP